MNINSLHNKHTKSTYYHPLTKMCYKKVDDRYYFFKQKGSLWRCGRWIESGMVRGFKLIEEKDSMESIKDEVKFCYNKRQEWDEEGFPLVGAVCEAYTKGGYVKVKILEKCHNGNCEVFACRVIPDCQETCGILFYANSFRKITSEKDKAIKNLIGKNLAGWIITKESASALYNLGWRPSKNLEEKL